MIKVGIIGLGGMGNMHFGVYEEVDDAGVVALADADEERLKPGKSAQEINVGEGGASIDPEKHSLYTDAEELLADGEVDMVDICLPTFLHAEFAVKAIEAGKHVLCEKPMALTREECDDVLAALDEGDVQMMVAQCIRFWPEYVYLKETVESNRMGKLLSAEFWRGGSIPEWSWDGWLKDHERSGGAILDLHVHDTDFVQYLLGRPRGVCSTGAIGPSGGYDVVDTVYLYEDKISVHTGANMGLPPAFGFEMKYAVAFEKGCLTFSSKHSPGLMEFTSDGSHHPDTKQTDGYHEEIEYFVECLENNEVPAVCTPESAAYSIALAEAEISSIESGDVVEI